MIEKHVKLKAFSTGMGAFLMMNVTVCVAAEPAVPEVNAKAFVLMDYMSGKILAQNNGDERLDPASLTKIMTSYVIGEAIKSGKITPNDTVTVGKDAWATGNPVLKGSSLMFLKPGDQVSVLDLNKGIAIQSGNDASIALADYIAGSQDAFVGLMNEYVNRLGLKNTHFKTVHGLDSEGQYSTARDMALLTQAMLRDVPDEYALHREKEFTFNKIRQLNRNRLLWNTTLNVDGGKTGYTSGAGYNLVASAYQEPMRLISVVLGAPSDKVRFSESEKLLSWGFNHFDVAAPIKTSTTVATEKVWLGKTSNVELGISKDTSILVPKGQAPRVQVSHTLTEKSLKAPLLKGQVVGTVDFIIDGHVVDKQPLIVKEAVEEAGFFGRLWDWIALQMSSLWKAIF